MTAARVKTAAAQFERHLRGLLDARKIPLRELITRAHGSPASTGNVYPVLRGASRLTPAKAAKWAAVLEVSPDDLLEANRPVREAAEAEKEVKAKSTAAKRPSVWAYVESLWRARGIKNETEFSRALGLKNSGDINQLLKLRRDLTPAMAQRWSAVLGVPADELLEKVREARAQKRSAKPAPVTALARPQALTPPATPTLAAGEDSQRVSFTVNGDGTANLRLNLPGLRLEEALKLTVTLDLPDLLVTR